MKLIILLALFMGQMLTGNYRKVFSIPPVSAWPMNEGSGLTLNDVSGHSNTATISGAGVVTWQSNAGLPGTTPLWTGTGTATSVSTTLANFTGTTPFTVSVWENTTAANGTFVSATHLGGTIAGWELLELSSAAQFLIYHDFSGGNYLSVGIPVAPNTGIHNIVAAYSGSQTAAGVKMYLDGALVTGTVAHDALTLSSASPTPVMFGKRFDGSVPYTGAEAFVEIWPVMLSASTISANYARGPAIY